MIKYIIKVHKLLCNYNIIKCTDYGYVWGDKPKFRMVVTSGGGREMGLGRGPKVASTLCDTSFLRLVGEIMHIHYITLYALCIFSSLKIIIMHI